MFFLTKFTIEKYFYRSFSFAADPSAGWLGFIRPRDCNRAYLDFSYCVWEELHAVSIEPGRPAGTLA